MTSEQTTVREELREIAEPLRARLQRVDRELVELQTRERTLRQDRRDIVRVLSLLDNSPTNRKSVKVTNGKLIRDEEKRNAVRDFLDANRSTYADGFIAAEINRAMKEDNFGPAMSPGKTLEIVREMHANGILRADHKVKGGAMLYVFVGGGNGDPS